MIGGYTMGTIQAVFENGVFRPISKVALPEKAKVEFEPRVLELRQSGAMSEAFEILSHSYETGQADIAARHDEHQP
jgi:predicted DNA-binding antitoxin AbrB/MazE fold protein